jgi:hypothetical protein
MVEKLSPNRYDNHSLGICPKQNKSQRHSAYYGAAKSLWPSHGDFFYPGAAGSVIIKRKEFLYYGVITIIT